jgi:ferritin-like metal-binding protein YciE
LTHLEETKQHVKRFDDVFRMHGAQPDRLAKQHGRTDCAGVLAKTQEEEKAAEAPGARREQGEPARRELRQAV